MREGLWRTKKGGPQQKSKNPQKSKNGIWEVGEAVRNGAQAIFSLVTMAEMVRKSIKCRFGASEIVCRPVNICTMKRICARTRF